MDEELQTMATEAPEAEDQDSLLAREWLVTNGLGGYASGSVAGAVTRRYHGLLVAALPVPFGRTVMLSHLFEELHPREGEAIRIGGYELVPGEPELHGARYLKKFRVELGVPIWSYEIEGAVVEKRIIMPYEQNTVMVLYRLAAGDAPMELRLWPSFHFLPHDAAISKPLTHPYMMTASGEHYEVYPDDGLPPLRMRLYGERGALVLDEGRFREIFYRVEASRGYDARGTLFNPGYFRVELGPGAPVTLVASTEEWTTLLALSPDEALQADAERRRRLLRGAHPKAHLDGGSELIPAADQFIMIPHARLADAARAHAAGDEVRSVIAGYHWFTDWGRDTMISLEGLTLATGRVQEAGWILRTFAHYIRDGLIPNMFPESANEGRYNTADATLWFFHALERYLEHSGDRPTLRLLLPQLEEIVDWHIRGTRFGIGIDPGDGLLRQGEEGLQLTWMDAKVDNWVVTPRRGKAVEINALWFNALRLLERWVREERGSGDAHRYEDLAEKVCESFNRRFWYKEGRYLYDIVDGESGDDHALRPNQVFAISLPHPVLDRARWEDVLSIVEQQLLTPVGLRSLAPGQPEYKSRYDGDLRARDAAYHQGTVWGWLIGPFIDAWIRLHPERRTEARQFLEGFIPHLDEACVGSISEIFDAEPPFTPRGCIAQAWSVAEVLRCWIKTAP